MTADTRFGLLSARLVRCCIQGHDRRSCAIVGTCVAVVLFSEGHSLHASAEPFGRILVYLATALFVLFGASIGLLVNSWFFLHKLK